MIPHDPALDAAYGKLAWAPLCRVTFLDAAGTPLSSPSPIVPSGRYVADASQWPRQTLELTLPTAITPDRTASPVSPYGGSVLLDVGARVLGRESWFRVATLDVTETSIDRPEGTITVSAASHEARVDEDRTDRAASSAGTGTALVVSLVRRTLGASHPVRNLVPPAQDPAYAAGEFRLEGGVWAVIEDIGDRSGFESWFDAQGALVMAPTPVKKATPDAVVSVGPGGQLTGYTSTRGWAYNRVAQVYEDDAGARRTGVWEDTNPLSATRVTGPYGRHTFMPATIRVDAGKLPTQAVADRAAASIARRTAAPFRSASLRTIPAPWVEPGDTVGVDFLGALTERLIVVRHEWPIDGLDVARMTAADDAYTSDLGSPVHA